MTKPTEGWCQITYVQHTHIKTAKAAVGPAKREKTFNIKFSTSNNMFCKATAPSHAHFMRQFGVLVKLIATQYSSLQPFIPLTFQATWSLANTPIVVFITVIFSSIVFSCSVLCKFCVFFFFYSRAACSKCGFFDRAVLFRFYHLHFVCIMYFYLNK